MKKIIAMLLCFSCLFTCATVFSGCTEEDVLPSSDDPVVVDVRIYKAGYGTEWFYAAKEKFEQLYKDKKYTLNVVEESSNVGQTMQQEIKLKKSNSIDLYITGESNFSEYLRVSRSALKSEDEVLLEDLNDVYSSPAIRFDGSEENVSIADKLNDSVRRFMVYNGTTSPTYAYLNKFKDNYYAFPWASGVSGFFVNKSVFDSFGLELPRTTDELLAAYDVMCPKDGSGEPTPKNAGVYPMIYAGQAGAGFWLFAYDTFFAQYSGVEAENNFWLCQPETGSLSENGYDVYEDEGIRKALEVVQALCDNAYCPNGTLGADEISAQLQVLQGKAAIMPTGNWVYHQMKLNYSSVVDNGIMMKMPVISELGKKLGITDKTLSSVIKGVDQGKSDSQIAAECSVSTDIAARVREARNVYFDYSSNTHLALIPSYSPSKDVAKLFLRFLASDDNLDLYKGTAYSSLPFKYAGQSKASDIAFVNSVDEIMGYGQNVAVYEDIGTSPIRQAGLHCFPFTQSYAETFKGMSLKQMTAKDIYEGDYTVAHDNWASLKAMAGIQ